MLNNVCFSRSKTKDDTTSIKSKGRFHFKYVVIFLSKVHSILLVGGFEGACQSNHRIIDRLAGDGGGG